MLGLLDPGGEDNVYEELLAKINKNKMSANILTVTVVDALSKLVYVAKSKKDKAPPNMLSKRQFAHVLGYICRREMLLEEVPDAVIRNVWNPRNIEKEMALNPNAVWGGSRYLFSSCQCGRPPNSALPRSKADQGGCGLLGLSFLLKQMFVFSVAGSSAALVVMQQIFRGKFTSFALRNTKIQFPHITAVIRPYENPRDKQNSKIKPPCFLNF